jgi:tetratricopeptide (TPR) repeat protein
MRSAFAVFIFVFVAAPVVLLAKTPPAESVDALVEQGAVFDRKLDAKEALSFYLPAEKLDPHDSHILVPIARQYRHLMTDAPTKEEKLRLGCIAMEYSKRACACGPHDAEAQLDLAITLGKMLPYMSAKQQVDASPRIKESVDKALALNPNNDTAWHILGRWNRVLAEVSEVKRAFAGMLYGRLPMGSLPDAEHAMQKAMALNPNRLMHYIELGRIYADMGRGVDARFYINKGLLMPDAEKDDPETKQRGRETLEKLH